METLYNKVEDYKNTHFDYPELQRIVGEPTLASLITLRNQVKANAQTVDSTLGGGSHGHLGLVFTPYIYTTINGTQPYVRPTLPSLNILPTDTQFQIAQKRHQYAEDLRQFREVNGVERAIIQQIVGAIEPKYLRALRDQKTNKISKTIPEILKYLFDTYGDVSPRELQQLRNQVENIVFDPSEPVDTIFSEIEDLETIAEIAENPLSERQKIDMAYLILQNCKRFSNGLKKWDKKAVNEQTWMAFMEFFRKDQKELRKCGELTLNDTLNKDDFVHLLTEGIKDGVEKALASREAETQESRDETNQYDDERSILLSKIEQMNATITQLQNDKQKWVPSMNVNPMWMNDMTNPMMMGNMYGVPPNQQQMQNNNSNNNNNSNRNQNRRNNRRRNPGRRFDFYNRYCWSCGGCDHWGRNCTAKKVGHIDSATFRNKQGGSVDNCFVN